jgi:hypothetical protein
MSYPGGITLAGATPTAPMGWGFLGGLYGSLDRWDFAAGNGGTKSLIVNVTKQTIVCGNILTTTPAHVSVYGTDVWNPAPGVQTWGNITVPANGLGFGYYVGPFNTSGWTTPVGGVTNAGGLNINSSSNSIYVIDVTLPWNNVNVTSSGAGTFKQLASVAYNAGLGAVAGDRFLARTTGLPTKYKDAYGKLFHTLTIKGFFDPRTGIPTLHDCLYIGRTYDTATAKLDLTMRARNLTEIGGTMTWAQNVGWTGGAGKALDTGFNPYALRADANTKLVQNSAHMMAWNDTGGGDTSIITGAVTGGGGVIRMFPKYSSGEFIATINSTGHDIIYNAIPDPTGMLALTRNTNAMDFSRNGASVATNTITSTVTANCNIYLMAANGASGVTDATTRTARCFSFGGFLTITQLADMKAALDTFWTDIA